LRAELEKDGRFAESEELMAAQARKDPRDIDALQHLGSIQATQRKYKEAIASFESGLVLAPDDPNLLRLCSIAYAKLGDYRKAIQLAEKLTRVVPKSNAALLLLAVNTEDSGDKAAAERHYRTLLARDPGNIIGQNNLALLLLARGETREAARLADALFKVAPNNADVRDSVGWIYFQTGRKSEALTLLQKLPPDSPSAGAWYHLAVALADKGELKKAAEAARKALALNPDFRYAREAKILAEAAK
jgi:tetratricopeptide (TPR) repeat protein